MTFKADAALKNPFYPLITDVVSAVNTQDGSVQTAAAYTLINTFPVYSPFVGK
jgi:hypothetical protein